MGTVRYTTVNGEIISEKRNGVRSLYVPDPLGSTVALLDNTQTKTDTFEYWPYGEVRTRTRVTATPFQYVGTLGYHQDSSGRTYVRARTLNTAQGRWMTEDPIGFDGGDWNLYRYVGNKTITRLDPSGMIDAISIWDQNQLNNCRKLSPGACFECANYFIRYGTRAGIYQGDYLACVRTNAFCHSHVVCEGRYVNNPSINPNPLPCGSSSIVIPPFVPYPMDFISCNMACMRRLRSVPTNAQICKKVCKKIVDKTCDEIYKSVLSLQIRKMTTVWTSI